AAGAVLNQFAGTLMAGLVADPSSPPQLAARALARLEQAGYASPAGAGHEALRCPSLLALEPGAAIECVLGLLLACTGARAVSLWGAGPTGRLAPICAAGGTPRRGAPSRRGAAHARAARRGLIDARGDPRAADAACTQRLQRARARAGQRATAHPPRLRSPRRAAAGADPRQRGSGALSRAAGRGARGTQRQGAARRPARRSRRPAGRPRAGDAAHL